MKPCTKFEERISEMLLGEIPENESQKLHIHMAGCDGCMEFYLSLYETLEAGDNDEFTLTEDQKKEIFDEAEKLDKPIKKLGPLWTTGVSIAASVVVSGLVIFSDSNLSAPMMSDSKERSWKHDSVNEIEVSLEELEEIASDANEPRQEAMPEDRKTIHKRELNNNEYRYERTRKKAPAKEKSKSFDYGKFGQSKNQESPGDIASPAITTVAVDNLEVNDAALEDTSDDSPSTDDNMLDQAVSDVVVSPSAFASPSIIGGRSRAGRGNSIQEFNRKNKNKKDSLKELEEGLDLVEVKEKEISQGGGVAGLDAGGDDFVAGIGGVENGAGGGDDLGGFIYQDGNVAAGEKNDALEDDPFAEADPFDGPASPGKLKLDSEYQLGEKKEDKKPSKKQQIASDPISNTYFSFSNEESGNKANSNGLPEEKNESDLKFANNIGKDKVGQLYLQREFKVDEKNGSVANQILLERAKALSANRRLLEAKGALEQVLTNEPFNETAVKSLNDLNKKLFESGKSRRQAQYQEYQDEVEWKWSDPTNLYSQLGKDLKKYKAKETDEVLRQNPEIIFHGNYLEARKLIQEGKEEEAKEQIKEAVRWAKSIAKTPDNEAKLDELALFVRESEVRKRAAKLKSEMAHLKNTREKQYPKVAPADRPMLSTQEKPMSTFSIDVDTASYQMAKQIIQKGGRPEPQSIRAEEFINSFDYQYEAPKKKAFKVHSEVVKSPFYRGSKIMKIGVQGKQPGGEYRASSHFCFIVDTSGSMADESRLPMVKKVLPMIINQMSPGDKVSLVSCGLKSRLELDYMDVKNVDYVNQRIQSLNAVGATNLEASLIDGYTQILKHVKKGSYSRVILFSDGVANLGEQNANNILKTLVHAKNKGAGITVIGMGEEEYNDNFLETLADKGDGNYVFIGNNKEARKTFEEKFAATFHTIAYNVKIQVEFDPGQVSKYRLLGYENRRLKNKDFRNDKVDAGEVGSGQSVTAIYEIEMTGSPSAKPIAEIRLRYRDAVDNQMHEFATPVLQKSYNVDFENASEETRLSLISGKFAEVLRDGGSSEGITPNDLLKYIRPLASQMGDPDVHELLNLIEKSR